MMAGSGLEVIADLKFEGSGSQSASLKYLQMVAQVVADATGDEQLRQIAMHLPKLGTPKMLPETTGAPTGPVRRGLVGGTNV